MILLMIHVCGGCWGVGGAVGGGVGVGKAACAVTAAAAAATIAVPFIMLCI